MWLQEQCSSKGLYFISLVSPVGGDFRSKFSTLRVRGSMRCHTPSSIMSRTDNKPIIRYGSHLETVCNRRGRINYLDVKRATPNPNNGLRFHLEQILNIFTSKKLNNVEM